MGPFIFSKVTAEYEPLVLKWLSQPHVQEWYHGEGRQNTIDGLRRFVRGEKATYDAWIGFYKGTPFAYLMTSVVSEKEREDPESPFQRWVEPGKQMRTLDLLIGETDFLGRGLAKSMVESFVHSRLSDVDIVFIDPEKSHAKAIHVYENAGFEKIDEFIASWHPVPHCLMRLEQQPFTLRRLGLGDETAFLAAYQEFKEAGDLKFASHYKTGMAFSELLSVLKDQEAGVNLPEGFVRSTFLFSFSRGKILGRVMIRHELNDFLRRIGGHIGYGVVPSERRKGFATRMLRTALPIARELGIDRALITCDEGNLPSQKIIESTGGEFEGLSEQGTELPAKRLYWIDVSPRKQLKRFDLCL